MMSDELAEKRRDRGLDFLRAGIQHGIEARLASGLPPQQVRAEVLKKGREVAAKGEIPGLDEPLYLSSAEVLAIAREMLDAALESISEGE